MTAAKVPQRMVVKSWKVREATTKSTPGEERCCQKCSFAHVDEKTHTVLGACSYGGTCVLGATAGEEPHCGEMVGRRANGGLR